MFVPKVLFGEVVLAKVFSHSDPNFYSESEFDMFAALNEKEFRLAEYPKKDNKDKRKFLSIKEFSQLVATSYDVIKFVRLFDFYDTAEEMAGVNTVRS